MFEDAWMTGCLSPLCVGYVPQCNGCVMFVPRFRIQSQFVYCMCALLSACVDAVLFSRVSVFSVDLNVIVLICVFLHNPGGSPYGA